MKKLLLLCSILAATLFAEAEMTPEQAAAIEKAKVEAAAKAEANAKKKQAEEDRKSLELAYAKEFAFLKAQKESLQKQLSQTQSRNSDKLRKAKKEVNALEQKLLGFELKIDGAQEKLLKAQQREQGSIDTTAIIDGTVTQAKATLDPYGIMVKWDKDASYAERLDTLFGKTAKLINELGSIRSEKGAFYLPDGRQIQGDIIKIGNIAAYGIASEASGALAPAGNNSYKLWKAPEAKQTAEMLASGNIPVPMHVFIYESLKKEVEYAEDKTILEIINDGGIIGWIIVVLGLIGLLLVFIRFILLSNAGSRTESLANFVARKVESGDIEGAMRDIENKKSSIARVLKATLRNINRDRAHLEDIIAENMLNESSRLDKFGSVVLVFAAVAPLLGLLGTVTGMIATFDIITEYGTGDPKLLAGGISIALVTTELGLIVAIPLLLLGNLLTGWSSTIKDKMEQSALNIVNVHQQSR